MGNFAASHPGFMNALGKEASGDNKKDSKSSENMQTHDFPSYKKGGIVKKTGLAKLHKGEKVLTKRQAKKASHRKVTRKK